MRSMKCKLMKDGENSIGIAIHTMYHYCLKILINYILPTFLKLIFPELFVDLFSKNYRHAESLSTYDSTHLIVTRFAQ